MKFRSYQEQSYCRANHLEKQQIESPIEKEIWHVPVEESAKATPDVYWIKTQI